MRRSRLGIFSLSYIKLFDFLVEFLLFSAIQKHTIGYNHAKAHQANASTCREHKRNDVELSSHARYVYYESKSVGFVKNSMLSIVLHKLRSKSLNNDDNFFDRFKNLFLYFIHWSYLKLKPDAVFVSLASKRRKLYIGKQFLLKSKSQFQMISIRITPPFKIELIR